MKKLTAIVKAFPRDMNMVRNVSFYQTARLSRAGPVLTATHSLGLSLITERIRFQDEIDEVEKVRKEWKDLLVQIPKESKSPDVQEILDSIKNELKLLGFDGSNYSVEEIESIISQRKVRTFFFTHR